MTDRLYLFAPSNPDSEWTFCLISADGAVQEGRGLDTAAAAQAATAERSRDRSALQAILAVPAECLLRTVVAVPARGRRQIAMAVPYLVEEYLAEDVEGLHLALGSRQGDGRTPVAVLDPQRLQAWLDTTQEVGITVAAAYGAAEGLLAGPADIEVIVDAETAWVGCRNGEAVAIDRGLLLQALSQRLAEVAADDSGAAPTTIGLTMPEADPALDLAQLDSLLGQIRPIDVERRPYGGASRRQLALALALAGQTAVDLLQGRFGIASTGARPWQRWRLVAGLAAGLLLLQMGLDLARTSWLEQRAMALREESVALFQEIYPERTRVPDPRRELEAMLEGGGASGASFLELLGASAMRISALEAGPLQLRSLSFNAQRGDLALDLNAAGIGIVDRFKAGMEAEGYPVVIDSAVQEAQTVRARLRISSEGV